MRRNILDTHFWPEFLKRSAGKKIVLIVEKGKEEMFLEKFSTDGNNVFVEGYEPQKGGVYMETILFLLRNGCDSHSTKLYRMRAYKRGQAGVCTTVFKHVLAKTLGRISLYKRLVRFLASTIPIPKEVDALYEKYKPDCVFAPSLIDHRFDALFSIAARKRGVKVIGMVRSWDNFNNHGLVPFVPDKLLLQNVWLKEAAQKFQAIHITDSSAEIIGLPHYDIYHDPREYIEERDVFFKQFGLDPNKKFIIFGGSDFYYTEDAFPKLLNSLIEDGSIQFPVQVVFRPHPASPFKIAEYGIDALPHIKLDDAFSGAQKFSDTKKFINFLVHADIVMSVCSTMSIDAAVFDRPAISVNFDSHNRKISYYESVHRLHDSFDHFERLVETGGARTPRSPEELVADINEYLAHPETDAEKRGAIVDAFAAPFDGKAGHRLALTVADFWG